MLKNWKIELMNELKTIIKGILILFFMFSIMPDKDNEKLSFKKWHKEYKTKLKKREKVLNIK